MTVARKLIAAVSIVAISVCASACAEGEQETAPGAQAEPEGQPEDHEDNLRRLAERAEQAREKRNATPDTQGSGAFPALKEEDPGHPDHVVYRPADLDGLGEEKLGLYVFGNGGCSNDGASARLHLLEIASHGYLAIAPGRIRNGPNAAAPQEGSRERSPDGQLPPPKTSYTDLIESIDWALAENERPESPYYGKIDVEAIAASGHSCGGLQAIQAGADPRVGTTIVMYSGVFADGSNPISGMTVSKDMLGEIDGPMLYILGGETDVAYPNGMDDFAVIDHLPVFVANSDVGHGGTFWEPNGGAAAAAVVDWLDWRLKGDETAAESFQGEECGLCVDPQWTIDKKKID